MIATRRDSSTSRPAQSQFVPGRIADPARRMRLFAAALLLLMAALFFAARELEQYHANWAFLRAFAEAAMVGGLADWFAVTALFRHPLGLPIPHTAIIPDNKDRIADSMAAFLRANFLTPPVVARRLRGLNAANAAGQYLANPRTGESRLCAGAADLIADVLESLDQEKLGGMAKAALRSRIERLALAPLLGNLLAAMIAEGRHLPLLEGLIRRSAEALEANEDLVRRMIHDKANTVMRWTGLDERLANGILDGLYKLLAETVVIEDHPLRRKIEESLAALAEALTHDPDMQERVEAMKRDILANPAFAAWLDGLWERGRAQLLRAVRSRGGAGADGSDRIGASLAELGRALQHDARLQVLVNRFARRTLVGVVTRYGGEIVRLVSETVRRWDARTVTDRIEGAVGRDLQFIRINGTLVGGLVGVAIHAVDVLL